MGGLLLVELALWFALCKTYSRGSLAGVVSACVFFATVVGFQGPSNRIRRLLDFAAWRIIAAIALLFVTGFWVRITPQYATADRAVGNRLELWQSGLSMMASAPVSGWGRGESGRAYMNWFQPIERTERYSTMVNSYLHAGVEYGIVALGLIVAATVFIVFQSIRPGGSESGIRRRIRVVAGATVVSWAVVNIFSTLWIDWRLWILPTIAILLLAPFTLKIRRWCLPLGAGLACGLVVATGLALSGRALLPPDGLRVTAPGDGVVRIEKGHRPLRFWQVRMDQEVLGRAPGKEIRRWIKSLDTPCHVVVHAGFAHDGVQAEKRTGTILFGRQAKDGLHSIPGASGNVVIVHPVGRPPAEELHKEIADGVVVLLPEIDEAGNQPAWKRWARQVNARVFITPGVGTDIRAVWPEVWKQLSLDSLNEVEK